MQKDNNNNYIKKEENNCKDSNKAQFSYTPPKCYNYFTIKNSVLFSLSLITPRFLLNATNTLSDGRITSLILLQVTKIWISEFKHKPLSTFVHCVYRRVGIRVANNGYRQLRELVIRSRQGLKRKRGPRRITVLKGDVCQRGESRFSNLCLGEILTVPF